MKVKLVNNKAICIQYYNLFQSLRKFKWSTKMNYFNFPVFTKLTEYNNFKKVNYVK